MAKWMYIRHDRNNISILLNTIKKVYFHKQQLSIMSIRFIEWTYVNWSGLMDIHCVLYTFVG